jgi:hypothetical protein
MFKKFIRWLYFRSTSDGLVKATCEVRRSGAFEFQLLPAENGYILTRSWYDNIKDKSGSRTVLITDDCDISVEVAQFVQIEMLRGINVS